MRSIATPAIRVASAALLLGFLVPTTLSHGDSEAMDMHMGSDMSIGVDEPQPEVEYPPSYFSHPDHRGVLLAHIGLMVLAWVMILPLGKSKASVVLRWDVYADRPIIATMFSLARSRYTLPVQFVFFATNALGVLFSTIYNAKTPDLYPNNAHHKLGWLVTWVISAQVVVGLLGRVAGAFTKSKDGMDEGDAAEGLSFMPISRAAMDEHHRFHGHQYSALGRSSNDSGQGTEPNTESSRKHSFSSSHDTLASPTAAESTHKEFVEDDGDLEAHELALSRGGTMRKFLAGLGGKNSSRAWQVMIFGYNFVDRTSLILSFITLATGIIALARFFVS